jgi:lipopolysaccharide biosynthesis glycosyltransferase/predicted Zn-dependent protease
VDPHTAIVSVGTFFRDARIHGASSRLRPHEAAAIVSTFFERYSLEACTADQLLALADLCLRAKTMDVARDVLHAALQTAIKAHLAYYKLGRLELAEGRLEAAAECFAWGIEAETSFAFNYMGSARALYALGRTEDAARQAEIFAGFNLRPHGQDEIVILTELADFLFDSGGRARSRTLYRALAEMDPENPRIVVRLAETLIAEGDFAAARAILLDAQDQGRLDLWGRRAVAQCEGELGNYAAAIAVAEAVVIERPSDAGFQATYIDVLIRSGNAAAWRDAASRMAAYLSPTDISDLTARASLAEGAFAAAADCLLHMELRAQTRSFYLAIETAYAALAAADFARAGALVDLLKQAAPRDIGLLLLATDMLLRQQLWEHAEAQLLKFPAAAKTDPHVVLRWFELACFTGATDKARKLQAKLERGGLPSRQFMLPIMRFLAEQQQWSQIVDRALLWLADDFNYEQIGYVLFRAAKRSGRHGEILDAIAAVSGWRDHAELLRLHTTIAWDRASTLRDMDQVAAGTPLPEGDSVMRRRMEVQRQVMARATAPSGRRALFMCSNANYLCATIVALHSALRHSAPGREDAFIVVDDGACALANDLVQPFRDRKFSITIVPASEVVDAAEKLHAAYGLFTSGHVLASAAYYRIYFARHLQKSGAYDRALYIDSDVLIRRGLDTLFEADLQGQPLAARLETARPEVTRAIALHGLSHDLYFNSGVLLFDLKHDEQARALDAAVAAILDDDVTLLFHDQCALNLGFRGRFHPLAMAWNMPVGERTRLESLPPETGILHYLDRPKPWSAAYGGACGTLWFDQWLETATLVGEAKALDAFNMSSD